MALLLCAGTSSSVCVLKLGLANLGSEAEGGVRISGPVCVPLQSPWGPRGARTCGWVCGTVYGLDT